MDKSEAERIEAVIAGAEDMQRKWQDATIRLEFAKKQFEHAKLCYELAVKVLEAKHCEPLADKIEKLAQEAEEAARRGMHRSSLN